IDGFFATFYGYVHSVLLFDGVHDTRTAGQAHHLPTRREEHVQALRKGVELALLPEPMGHGQPHLASRLYPRPMPCRRCAPGQSRQLDDERAGVMWIPVVASVECLQRTDIGRAQQGEACLGARLHDLAATM